jgi:hypothetical protein
LQSLTAMKLKLGLYVVAVAVSQIDPAASVVV